VFRFRRWWLLCGAVLVGVVALNGVVNGVVDAQAAPTRGAVCMRGGATATDAVSGRRLVCVQTKVRGLRWWFRPAAVTTTTTITTTSPSTTTTTTVPGVVAPRLVSVSASDGVQITVAGMRPDTGVYSLQWVLQGSTFNTYQMARATSPSMNVPAGWFACNRTYTFRVFVMQADWQLADGHQTQNVTPHSTPFDVVMPACPAPATPVTCATGGVCVVGDTGPGGGIVFYVSATAFTSTGSTCNTAGAGGVTACKYLEAAPTAWGNGITVEAGETTGTSTNDPILKWCSNTGALGTTATAIGTGMANTTTADTTCTSGAIQSAADYTNNGKTDWHLPSRGELFQLYIQKTTVGGFSSGYYWSSSEVVASSPVWDQDFDLGNQSNASKDTTDYVRPVRAFG